MNDNLRPNMSIEDSENNNVDENSNDHQYNQYANYHNQFTNHEFRNHSLDNGSVEQINNFVPSEAHFSQRVETDLRQHTHDEVDARINSRYSNSVLSHRRNLSEDLSVNSSYLPPLPSNNFLGARENLLDLSARHSRAPWLPSLPRRGFRPSDEEIRNEGEELLYNFAAEQFQEEQINPHQYLPARPSFSNPSWKKAGRDLRILADEFSRSQERKELRFRAQQVNMSSLTCENFFQLCSELFRRGEGGITQERIVVLFTFISDIAIQQVKQRAERFISQLMQWSLRFIFEHICAWVREAGGWEVVLSRGVNFVYKVTICTLAIVSIVALTVFIKKNWKYL